MYVDDLSLAVLATECYGHNVRGIDHVAGDQALDALQVLEEPTAKTFAGEVGLGTLDESKAITETVAHPWALRSLVEGRVTGGAKDVVGVEARWKVDWAALGSKAWGWWNGRRLRGAEGRRWGEGCKDGWCR